MRPNSQIHLDFWISYSSYRFPSQGNMHWKRQLLHMKCIWLHAKPRAIWTIGAHSPRFDCWQPPTNTHVSRSSPVADLRPCLKDSGMQEAFLQSQIIQNISKTFEISSNCSQKRQPSPGRKGCCAAFTAAPLFFLASERVARSPVAKAFPSLTCQPRDDFKVHADMRQLVGICYYTYYMLICSLPNSGCQWLPNHQYIQNFKRFRQWGSPFISLHFSASFAETASLKP